ncbi:MAG: hypothetical protein ACXVCP_13690 [Bdellovibrio sp.]
MLHPLSFVKLSVLFYFIASSAGAQVYSSSISAATGGTGRATVEAGDSAFLNPGTLVHLRGHSMFTSFSKDEFAVSLTDNTEDSFLPSALSYVQRKSTVTQGELQQHDILLSLAEFAVDKIAFGITGHYLEHKLATVSYRQSNADLGVIYTPQPHIGWALVAYNVFGEDKDIPQNFRSKRSVAAGFNYIYKSTVRARLDATTDSVFMAGLETYVNQFLITRLGYQNDTDDKREIITAGAGFKGPRFAIDYAYQGNSQISGDYRHSVDLVIPF